MYKKLFFLGLFITLFCQPLQSQNNCLQLLEQAEVLFEQGIIEEIPELLSGCLEDGFSPENLIRAQKLLIFAYLIDNKTLEAENVMKSFLKNNPEYEIQPGDPAEFKLLLSDFRTIPFLSVGPFLGGNFSSATFLEHYGPYNTSRDEGEFLINSPQFQIGAAINVFLTERLEGNLESIYTINSFSYSNLQYGFAEIYKTETQRRLEFPVSLSYDLSQNNWQPYLRVGLSYGLLMSAHSDYKRTYLNSGEEQYSPIEELGVDISEQRNSSFVNAVFGAGLKYKIPRGHLYFDIRYFYGLSDLVNPEGRWSQDTVFEFYTADNDFHLDYITFSIGYRYSFYITRRN